MTKNYSLTSIMQGPTECVLNRYYKQDSGGQLKEVTDCFYYVPLLESLQRILDCKVVCDHVSANSLQTITAWHKN